MQVIENAIPRDIAEKLCEEVRAEYQGKWWTLAGLQCWGCTRFSHNDVNQMCLSSASGNRGCELINTRYDRLRKIEHT